jgi:outer membrane protein assembly factor BamB
VADGENALHALALANGKTVWRFKSPTPDPFPAPPAVFDVDGDGVEDAVALNDNGFVYALDGRAGKVLWQLEHSPARARTRNRVVFVPGTSHGVLANAKGSVLWINLRDGQVVWRATLREGVLGEPAVADMDNDGVADVVLGTVGRRLYCLSGKNGSELWSSEVGAQVRFSAPLLLKTSGESAPLVFVGTGPPANALYCLSGQCPRLNTRPWLSPWR